MHTRNVVISLLCAVVGGAAIEALGVLSGDGFSLLDAGGVTLLFIVGFVAFDLLERVKSASVQAASYGLGLALMVVVLDVIRGNEIDVLAAALTGVAAAAFLLLVFWGINRLGRWAEKQGDRQPAE